MVHTAVKCAQKIKAKNSTVETDPNVDAAPVDAAFSVMSEGARRVGDPHESMVVYGR
jgi:hypothetical protein